MNAAYALRTRRLNYFAIAIALLTIAMMLFRWLPFSALWYVPLTVSLAMDGWVIVRSSRYTRYFRRRMLLGLDDIYLERERLGDRIRAATWIGTRVPDHLGQMKLLRETLTSLLDEANRHRLSVGLPLHITGSLGGRYLIKCGYIGNVIPLDDKGRTKNYGLCAVIRAPGCGDGTRTYVTRIAQILLIQTDEQRFLDTANRV